MNPAHKIPGDLYDESAGAVYKQLFWQVEPLDFNPSTILFRRLIRAALFERTTNDKLWIEGAEATVTFDDCCEAIGLNSGAARRAILTRLEFTKVPKENLKRLWDNRNREKIAHYRRMKKQEARRHKEKLDMMFAERRERQRRRREGLPAAPAVTHGAATTEN